VISPLLSNVYLYSAFDLALSLSPDETRLIEFGCFAAAKSADRPRLLALPPRWRDGLGRSLRLPLKDSKTNVSSASTMPDKEVGLSRLRAARNR
jgi:hypothetical protein